MESNRITWSLEGIDAMEWYKRGTLVASGWRARRGISNLKFWGADRTLHLAGTSVGPADETKHFKLIGTTGTGKSTAITELLAGALERGDRAVIADPDGGYLARFHDRSRGDVILNPFEPRSVKWNPFAEIHTPYDVEQLASGLIPTRGRFYRR
jgi:type IV secretory pathway TraG/TraD family ATPase VirD4